MKYEMGRFGEGVLMPNLILQKEAHKLTNVSIINSTLQRLTVSSRLAPIVSAFGRFTAFLTVHKGSVDDCNILKLFITFGS